MFAHFPNPNQSHGNSSTSVDEEQERRGSDKDVSTSSTHLSQTSNTYHELGDGQVMEILKKYQMVFQSGGVGTEDEDEDSFQGRDDSELVLFRGAIEHATRISRIMVNSTCIMHEYMYVHPFLQSSFVYVHVYKMMNKNSELFAMASCLLDTMFVYTLLLDIFCRACLGLMLFCWELKEVEENLLLD